MPFTAKDLHPCRKCGAPKPRGEKCKPCRAEYQRQRYATWTPEQKAATRARQREWRERNPDAERIWKLQARYGLTVAQYDAMVAEQNGLCAICREPETARWRGTGRIRLLSVDHCHATGKVRGLLCHSCNRVLGLLGDDDALLESALAYLRQGGR